MQDRHRQFDEIFLQRTAGPYIRVKLGSVDASRLLPLRPNEQTSRDAATKSVSCQQETHAPQQMAFAFNDRIGAGEQ
jgi:hypothetical protein